LNGSGSSYGGTETLNYQWEIVSRPANSNTIIINDREVTPSFVPDRDGQYTIRLSIDNGVIDNNGELVSDMDEVIITATTVPVANAGSDGTVSTGSTVVLNGAGSSTSNGAPLTYQWTMVDKPITSLATLSDSTAMSPVFLADVRGSYTIELMVHNGSEFSAVDSVTITVIPPVAEAGANRNVSVQESIRLDGSGSFDASNTPITYEWSIVAAPSGSTATLIDSTAFNPEFTADVAGPYDIALVVYNGTEYSEQDIITITASLPIAHAGADFHVTTGNTVSLNGGGSSDTNGYPLTYSWVMLAKPANSVANLLAPDSRTPSFVADLDGDYEISLNVNNSFIDSLVDVVTVNATTMPIANAGNDQSVSVEQTVTLDGSASSDSTSLPLSYTWRLLSVPSGSGVSLTNANSVDPTFTPDVEGSYTVGLIVNNGVEGSVEDSVTINALLPVADTGSNFNPAFGTPYFLDGRASYDPNNNALTYNWSIHTSPLHSNPVLSDPTLVVPELILDMVGAYEVDLVVNNGYTDSVVDTVLINSRNTVGRNSGIFSDDFENGLAQTWSVSNGTWAAGEPTSGPNIAYVERNVLATNLSGVYTSTSRVSSVPIPLPAVITGESIYLSFWHWFYIFPGSSATNPYGCSSGRDYGRVDISEEVSPDVWSDWTTLPTASFSGSSGGWTYVLLDITTYAEKNIKIGFNLINNPTTYNSCSGLTSGWYIDELLIEKTTP
ncbi:PKD domain-containing protein, partial [Kaarinaea lacus]